MLASNANISSRLMWQNRSETITKSLSHFCSLKEIMLAAHSDSEASRQKQESEDSRPSVGHRLKRKKINYRSTSLSDR